MIYFSKYISSLKIRKQFLLNISKVYLSKLNNDIRMYIISEKMRKASVLLVGVEGLGSPIARYLTAAGLGTLGIMEATEVINLICRFGDLLDGKLWTIDLGNMQTNIISL